MKPGAVHLVVGIAVGVGTYELVRLLSEHEAEIVHGLSAASEFVQRHPGVNPPLAAAASLISHHGNIVAASAALAEAYEREGIAALHSGERVFSASLSASKSAGASLIHASGSALSGLAHGIGSIF